MISIERPPEISERFATYSKNPGLILFFTNMPGWRDMGHRAMLVYLRGKSHITLLTGCHREVINYLSKSHQSALGATVNVKLTHNPACKHACTNMYSVQKAHTVTVPISTCAWTSLGSTVIRFTSRLCKPSSSKDKHSLFSQTSIEVIFKALQLRNENHFLLSWIQKCVLMFLLHFMKYSIPGKQILAEKSSNLLYIYIMKIQFLSNILWDSDDTFWKMFFFSQQDSAKTLSHSLKSIRH